MTLSSFDIAKAAARIADDKIGQDIVVIDVRALTSLADVFVFVGATSHLHVKALEDAIREGLKEAGAQLIRTDGQRGHLWRVLDYGQVLIHVMDQKTREFYAVERLWAQGRRIEWAAPKPAAKPAPQKSAAPSPAAKKPAKQKAVTKKKPAPKKKAPTKKTAAPKKATAKKAAPKKAAPKKVAAKKPAKKTPSRPKKKSR